MGSANSIIYCSVSELTAKKQITKWVDTMRDELTAVFDDENITVFSSVCPHFGGELEFDCVKNQVRCRWHGWKFDRETGVCGSAPLKAKLRKYRYSIQSDQVVVSW